MPRAVVAIGGNSLIPDAMHVTVQDQYAAAAETEREFEEVWARADFELGGAVL